jgi:endonuclease YncB( thermonuclease family)
MVWLALCLLGLFLPAAAQALVQGEILGVARVIDGDTIDIQGQRIRLHGIDAPESSQECLSSRRVAWRCGQHASQMLAEHIGTTPIGCRLLDRDRHGRFIAICRKGAEDLSRWMVANGWAVAFRRFSLDYAADEERARSTKKGLWEGSFEMPWDWRAQRRAK